MARLSANGNARDPQTAVRNAEPMLPADEFILDFAKLEVSYFTQNADGRLGTEEKAGWDFRANKKV